MTRFAAIALVVALAVAGCGGGSNALSDDGANELSVTVADLRAAAAVRDEARARADLVTIRSTVARLQQQGDISDERAADVLASADEVERSLVLITTTTTAPPPIYEDDDDEGKGKGKHKDDDD